MMILILWGSQWLDVDGDEKFLMKLVMLLAAKRKSLH